TEEKNKKFDINRLTFIQSILTFITKYHRNDRTILTTYQVKLSDREKDGLNRLILWNTMELLKFIAVTVSNLSGELRHKYKEKLGPSPFRWETFEQLAGLMVRQGSGYEPFVLDYLNEENAAAFKRF